MFRSFRSSHRILFPFLVALVAVVLVTSAVFAVAYSLNKTVPATVTITAPLPTEATLYTDALAADALPSGYTHSFGSVVAGGTPQNPLWFRAAEINPASINVTTTGLPGDAQVQFTVGTPIGGQPGQPCTLALWLPSDLPVGTHNFSFVVTGSSP